jgi:hypothetical protein
MLLYIDPGAGSLFIQAIIAALVSVPFLFRNAIRGAVQRFRRSDAASGDEPSRPADSDPR